LGKARAEAERRRAIEAQRAANAIRNVKR
jgi:hypothetical protein